jgi:hypothetical protein
MRPNVRQSEFLRDCGPESTGFLKNKVDRIFPPKLVNECFVIGIFNIANASLGSLNSMRRSKENYRLHRNQAPFDKIRESEILNFLAPKSTVPFPGLWTYERLKVCHMQG